MHTQIQLLIDATVVRARRVFDFEWLASDPIFEHLAGGAVPSIHTFMTTCVASVQRSWSSSSCCLPSRDSRSCERQPKEFTIDIDTTVTPLFGHQEGAVPGSNRAITGAQVTILARIADTNTVFGARLRLGRYRTRRDRCRGR